VFSPVLSVVERLGKDCEALGILVTGCGMLFKRELPSIQEALEINPDYKPKREDIYILDSIAKKYKGGKIGRLAESALKQLREGL
jgi:hypothetical protein